MFALAEFYGTYRGVVVNNNDPRAEGRLTLLIPQILGPAESAWATPSVPVSHLPASGDSVFVTFESGDVAHPVYHAVAGTGTGDNGAIPKQPTALSLSKSSYATPEGVTLARVTATWTAPTENQDGSVPVSLGGYFGSYSLDQKTWSGDIFAADTTFLMDNLPTGTAVYVRVASLSAQGQRLSPYSTVNITTDPAPANPPAGSTLATQASNISTAQSTANSAQTAANNAQSTANSAQTAANNAQSSANSAQTAASNAQSTANGKNTVTYSTSAPGARANTAGDIWWQYDSTSGHLIAQWQGTGGTTWISRQLDSQVIANLDVGKLTAGTLSVGMGLGSGGSVNAPGASSAKVSFDSTGIKAYNSSGTNTVAINSDGSASFTGQITMTGGSVPGANVSGTVSAASTASSATTVTGSIGSGVTVPTTQLGSGTLPTAVTVPASTVSGTVSAANTASSATTVTGSIGSGVTVPTTQLGSGTVPSGVTLPPAQLGSGTIASGATLPASQLASGNIPSGTTVTAVPATPSGSQKLTIDNTGIKAYNSAGTNTVSINSDGSASFTGSITSGSTITGATINGGSVIGADIATASSGQRIELTTNGGGKSQQVSFWSGSAYEIQPSSVQVSGNPGNITVGSGTRNDIPNTSQYTVLSADTVNGIEMQAVGLSQIAGTVAVGFGSTGIMGRSDSVVITAFPGDANYPGGGGVDISSKNAHVVTRAYDQSGAPGSGGTEMVQTHTGWQFSYWPSGSTSATASTAALGIDINGNVAVYHGAFTGQSINGQTDMQYNGRSLGRGLIANGLNLNTTSSGTTTTTMATILQTGSCTFVANRKYKITMFLNLQSTVAGDDIVARINVGATTVGTGQFTVHNANTSYGATLVAYFTNASGGSWAVQGQVQRGAGTGTINVYGSATQPFFIMVEDIGV